MAGGSMERRRASEAHRWWRSTTVSARTREIPPHRSSISEFPGMTVFVTPEFRQTLAGTYQQFGYDPLEVTPVAQGIEALAFPNGIYGVFDGRVELWQHASLTNPRRPGWETRRNLVNVPPNGIIRIEGTNGEYWQNPNYPQQGQLLRHLVQVPLI